MELQELTGKVVRPMSFAEKIKELRLSKVEFMKNYQESGDVMGMLSDYTEIMSQYTEMMSGLESIDTDSLSPADYAYYMEVYGRITQKLMEVSGT